MNYLVADWKRYVLFALLTVHTLWIAHHIYLATRDGVNPWKMGGYAMYVEPKRGVAVDVHMLNSDGTVQDELIRNIDLYDLYQGNLNFNVYCKPVTEKSLIRFVEDNEFLEYTDVRLELFAYRFAANPLRTDPYLIGITDIRWLSDGRFAYEVKMCGDEVDREGVVTVEL